MDRVRLSPQLSAIAGSYAWRHVVVPTAQLIAFGAVLMLAAGIIMIGTLATVLAALPYLV